MWYQQLRTQMIGLFRCKQDFNIHFFFLENLRLNCSWSAKLSAPCLWTANQNSFQKWCRTKNLAAHQLLLQTPSSAQMLHGICKLDSVAGEPITWQKHSNTYVVISQGKDSQNPGATILKHFKKLGILCKCFYCASCQRTSSSHFRR